MSPRSKAPRPARARAIAVLGMHRSGTSAAARMLQVLGVDLGGDLLEGSPSENPRGFLEDRFALEVCERVLEQLDMPWDSARLIDAGAWDAPALARIKLEACEGLRRRFGARPLWGVKNPRLARLLPFWSDVFRHLDCDPGYLVVLRNPLAVARSLERRNSMPAAKAYLLWLIHTTEAVLHSRGRPRVCVEYDELLDRPAEALSRVGRGLGLGAPSADDLRRLETARDAFVDPELRHSRFADGDLDVDPQVLDLCRRAYDAARRWSRGELADRQVDRSFARIQRELRSLAPLLDQLDAADRELARALARARREVEAHAAERAAWKVQDEAREREIERLQGELRRAWDDYVEQRRNVDRHGAFLAEARAHIDALQRMLAGRHRDLEYMRADREQEAALLRAELADQTGRLRAELEEQAARLRAEREEEAERLRRESAEERARLEAQGEATRARLEAQGEETRARLAAEVEETRGRLEARIAQESALRSGAEEELRVTAARAQAEAERARRSEEERAAERERGAGELARAREERALLLRDAGSSLRDAVADGAAELLAWIAAMRETSAWRLTRRVQSGLDRLRRRFPGDGLDELERLAQELRGLARARRLDLPLLAARARQVAATVDAIGGSEVFRAVRAATGSAYALRGRARPAGPVEHIRARAAALVYLCERMSAARFAGELAQLEVEEPEPGESGVVDVVIPVFEGADCALRCIESALAARSECPREIVVVDDGSRDGRLREALHALAREGHIRLLRNAENLGFVVSANRGMALHPDRDVVLLNSDAVVSGDWLDRLRRAAYADWTVGTVTPFSNNAEICSYPLFCRDNPLPDDVEALDEVFARANAGLGATLPTAVGFCTYIRRACLRAVGGFDEQRFGRGYGEENDFCMRARTHGWRSVLAADVFVGHVGGASFGASKGERVEAALRVLDATHPGYLPEVREFVRVDPLRWLRQRVDAARCAGPGPAVLFVTHTWGGGTGRHAEDLAARLAREGVRSLRCTPAGPGCVRIQGFDGPETPNLVFDLGRDGGHLVEVLRSLGVAHVHVHHSVELDPRALELPRALGVRYDFSLHDYFPLCPRLHLVDGSGSYCGEPAAQTCTRCVREAGSPAGAEIDVEEWRERSAAWLAGARRIFVPSRDAGERLERHFPGLRSSVRPHPEPADDFRGAARGRSARRGVRVAVIGAIGEHKGAARLLACARDAAERGLPLRFELVGYSDRDEALRATGRVGISGRYEEAAAQELLAERGCRLALLPSIWPETFCYTLSLALRAGLFPVAYDIGAIAERVRALGWGLLLPLDTPARELNDRLLALAPPPPPADLASRAAASYPSLLKDYYDDLVLEAQVDRG